MVAGGPPRRRCPSAGGDASRGAIGRRWAPTDARPGWKPAARARCVTCPPRSSVRWAWARHAVAAAVGEPERTPWQRSMVSLVSWRGGSNRGTRPTITQCGPLGPSAAARGVRGGGGGGGGRGQAWRGESLERDRKRTSAGHAWACSTGCRRSGSPQRRHAAALRHAGLALPQPCRLHSCTHRSRRLRRGPRPGRGSRGWHTCGERGRPGAMSMARPQSAAGRCSGGCHSLAYLMPPPDKLPAQAATSSHGRRTRQRPKGSSLTR